MDVAPELPRWLSVTIVDRSGRTLSGSDARGVLGLDRARRADDRRRQLLARRHARCARRRGARARRAGPRRAATRTPACPNAFGGFDETPETTSGLLGEFAGAGLVNIVGGCCGTTPEHIRMIADSGATTSPARQVPTLDDRYTTLQRPRAVPDHARDRVRDGRRAHQHHRARAKFAPPDRVRRLPERRSTSRASRCESGANLIDVNMDADLIDGEKAMTTFLNLVATEPEIAKVPIMIDSSKWSVIEAGLKCVQGQRHRELDQPEGGRGGLPGQGRQVKRYGAAVVVMCFDEQGQADTVDRKIEISERSYRLLIDRTPASTRRTSSSTPTSWRSRPGWRSTTSSRRRSSRRRARSSGAAPA